MEFREKELRAFDLLKRLMKIEEDVTSSASDGSSRIDKWHFIKIFNNDFRYFPSVDKLVIDFASEPIEGVIFKIIDDFLKKNNLVDNFCLVTSNTKGYDYKWCTYFSPYIYTLGKYFDGPDVRMPYREKYINKLVDNLKTGYYVCYNGTKKHHRMILLNELKRLNLENKGIISLLCTHPEHHDYSDSNFTDGYWETYFNDIGYPYKFESNFFTSHKLFPDKNILTVGKGEWPMGSGGKAGFYFNKLHFEQNYFSIVSETYPSTPNLNEDDTNSFTEKTIKAMLTSPFIINGERGVLDNLKKLGFETFPEWFDESYDDMDSDINKIIFIGTQIEKICSMDISEVHKLYVKTLPKIVYNQNKLIEIYKEWNLQFNTEYYNIPVSFGDESVDINCVVSGKLDEKLDYIFNEEYITKVRF